MDFMEDWEKTKKRFSAFWEGEILDRCMIAAASVKDGINWPEHPFPHDIKEQESWWFDGERVFKRQWDFINKMAYYGDAFPYLNLNTGTAGHVLMLKGVKCSFSPETVWSL